MATSTTAPRIVPETASRPNSQSTHLAYTAAALYAVVCGAAILRHEPWADEAQAWLLARDGSLFDLWTRLLHYEGSPGLWHTLLHFLIRLGLPYSAYNFVSGILGFTAAALLIWKAPFPLPIRLLLPFTYFLVYQYAVVARSYSLLPPLLFLAAAIYPRSYKQPGYLALLLSLMAATSVHGLILSASIGAAAAWRAFESRAVISRAARRQWALAAAGYCAVAALLVFASWPAKDVAFAESRGLANTSLDRAASVASHLLSQAFTGEWISSLVLIAICFPFLRRGGGALIFFPTLFAFWAVGAVIYSNEWHHGLLFLAWIFAMWISALQTRVPRPVLAALVAVIAVHLYWTSAAIAYDWNQPYSGSAAAARYFQQTQTPGLYAIGYPTTAIQPYFTANVFSDFNQGSPKAYWDWSKKNPANPENAGTSLPETHVRDSVLVGYKFEGDRAYWAHFLTVLGYQRIRHFDGRTFWRDRTLEPESFELYHRTPAAASAAVSTLNVAGGGAENQILAGFYGVEQGRWRWTARRFSVVLRPPASAARDGARLVLQFYLPDAQLDKLGPLTLSADVDGAPLAPGTFSQAGQHTYEADVPNQGLAAGLVAVNFRFDKAITGLNGDRRELGAIVSSVALEAK